MGYRFDKSILNEIDKKNSDGRYVINNSVNSYNRYNIGCANTIMILKQYYPNVEIINNTNNLSSLVVQYSKLKEREDIMKRFDEFCKTRANSNIGIVNFENYVSSLLSSETTYIPNQRFLNKEYGDAITFYRMIQAANDYFVRNYDEKTADLIINTFNEKYASNTLEEKFIENLGVALSQDTLHKKTANKYIRFAIYMYDKFFHDREANPYYSRFIGYISEQLEKQGDIWEW